MSCTSLSFSLSLAGPHDNFSPQSRLEKESTCFPLSLSLSMEVMSGLRKRVIVGLVLLMCTLTGHCSESAPSSASSSAAAAWRDARRDLRRMLEIVSHVEQSRARHSASTKAPSTSRTRTSTVEPKDLRNLKTDRGDQVVGE